MGVFYYKMFKALQDKLDKFQSLSEDDLMKFLFENDGLKDEIIYLNTFGQLYEGVDSEGKELGQYSPYTIQLKLTNTYGGDTRVDHITLRDTGEFYDSFKISLTPNYDLLITSQPQKDETNLLREFGEDIIGLTEESLNKIQSMVKFIAQNYVKQAIQ